MHDARHFKVLADLLTGINAPGTARQDLNHNDRVPDVQFFAGNGLPALDGDVRLVIDFLIDLNRGTVTDDLAWQAQIHDGCVERLPDAVLETGVPAGFRRHGHGLAVDALVALPALLRAPAPELSPAHPGRSGLLHAVPDLHSIRQ